MKIKMGSVRWSHVASAVTVIAALAIAVPSRGAAKGKISRNFYREPYANGVVWNMGRDYIDHGNTPSGVTGPMDVKAIAANQPIVAAADGVVASVNDTRAGCGCHSAYGPCANAVSIQHANGEITDYLHIAQGSATAFGIAVGVPVSAGQLIGIEGDVGWTCGDGRDAAATPGCVNSVPVGAGPCGRHLHFVVRRNGTGELVNPMTCGIPNNLYVDDAQYLAPCGATPCSNDIVILVPTFLSGMGSWRVYQAAHTIFAQTLTVSNQGSAVLHAGQYVRLVPGFHAAANSYFRAEIGPCNQTAVAP